MLQTQTVLAGTLDLLKSLSSTPELADFHLAGGTALALQIGHRISVDLDFLGARPFEPQEILDLLAPLGAVRTLTQSKNILILNVNGVKVDFVNYRYPLLEPFQLLEGIRLCSLPDIGAMKLAAITGRGRKRDFVDLYFLMKKFSLPEIMAFYRMKFLDGNDLMAARSLTYFTDADEDENPQLLLKADWETVKRTITNAAKILFN